MTTAGGRDEAEEARTTAPRSPALTLLAAAHPGPTVAVVALSALLCRPAGVSAAGTVLVVAAVLTGQLSIGWSNDLLDLARDRRVGRTDKPLATGGLPVRLARVACAAALVVTVPLSLALGVVPGLLHLVVVAAGWAYNLGLKSTASSWIPYAVAFGVLPVFVWSAGPATLPGWWVAAAGALLGVGAHLLNALPDLAEDAATGVRGLPHRLGATWARTLAVGLLAGATVLMLLLDADALPAAARLLVLALVAALVVAALRAPGRGAFRAAVGIAVVDVAVLVAAA